MPKNDKDYTCEACGEEYTKAWSDKESMEEAKTIWGKEIEDNAVAIICDDCFQRGYKKIYEELR